MVAFVKNLLRAHTFSQMLIVGMLMYMIWFLMVENYLMLHYPINKAANYLVTSAGNFWLNSIGYSSQVLPKGFENYGIFGEDASFVHVGSGCNGLEIYAIFTGLLILLPGNWQHKIWFIPLGILILFFSNSIRVALLFLDRKESYQLFVFNHKYTYVFAVYSLVFVLWIWWIFIFGKSKQVDK